MCTAKDSNSSCKSIPLSHSRDLSRLFTKQPLAVIFDMDGVMVDSEPYHYSADSEIFSMLGLDLGSQERDQFLGISASDMYACLISRYKLNQTPEELLDLDISLRKQHLLPPRTYLEPFPGLIPLLERLKALQIPLAVASSSVQELVIPILAGTGTAHFFSQIITGDQVSRAKPDPEIFILAAQKLKIHPGQCVVIEDSANGIRAARSAGMRCIGYAPRNKNRTSDADMTVSHFDEIRLALPESISDLP